LKLENIQQNYGIYIVALWSIVLGLQNLSNLVIITLSLQGLPQATSTAILIYRLVSGIFSLGFFVVAVGLWRLAHWGRLGFMAVATLFFVVSIWGLFQPELSDVADQQKWLLIIRYLVSAFLPLMYLNLNSIKEKFNPA
jgi:hypothetical protein